MFRINQLKKLLEKSEVLSPEDFAKYQKEAEAKGKQLETFLFEKKVIAPIVLYENAASFYGIPFIDLKNQTIRKDVLFMVPEPIAATHNIISFEADTKQIKLAVLDPEDIEIFEFIQKKNRIRTNNPFNHPRQCP